MELLLPNLILPFLLLVIMSIPPSMCALNERYEACGQVFRCGDANFTYPFWDGSVRPSYCGYPGFEVSCQSSKIPRLAVSATTYRYQYRILQSPDIVAHLLRVARDDLYNDACVPFFFNESILDRGSFSLSSHVLSATLFYGCPRLKNQPDFEEFSCSVSPVDGSYIYNYIYISDPSDVSIPNLNVLFKCSNKTTVLFDRDDSTDRTTNAVKVGFNLGYEANNTLCERCELSDGRCGYNTTSDSFVCYCSDKPYDLRCNATAGNPTGSSRGTVKLAIGLSMGITVAISAAVGVVIYLTKPDSLWRSLMRTCGDREKRARNEQVVQEFMRTCGSIAPQQYSYSDVRKMTNSFAHKLGHGGFGSVYKGTLADGREVAVKVLNDSKGNGEDFINEVAAISRTSHVNVVALLGFCYDTGNRALIYEFMPNGSLDKFLRGEGSSEHMSERHLEWKLMYEIAVGIARGLEYLHRGCNTRIVHFDIKPQNILLDTDFCPKISDFGLAKLCKKKESILSTLGARGTVGYIAPELVFPSFGGLSHKSDVYSYGMMVLEMAGLTRKLEIHSDQASENYFPNWIYEHVELGKGLPLEAVRNKEDEETAMKMSIVGLWSIQTNPVDRPSISKVVEMLESSLQSLKIPPKPFVEYPTAMDSQQESLIDNYD